MQGPLRVAAAFLVLVGACLALLVPPETQQDFRSLRGQQTRNSALPDAHNCGSFPQVINYILRSPPLARSFYFSHGFLSQR